MKKALLLIPLLLLAVVACTRPETAETLDEVGPYISKEPDWALEALRELAADDIKGSKYNTKYALLMSMALDKHFINLEDEDSASITSRWFDRHGTPDERLKALYYHGRLMQNAGYHEGAMRYFVRAEDFVNNSTDNYAKGNLYNAMAGSYMKILDIRKAYEAYSKAAPFFFKAGSIENYCAVQISIAGHHITGRRYSDARACLEEVKSYWNDISTDRKACYYNLSLIINMLTEDSEQLSVSIRDYLTDIDRESIKWLNLASAYCYLKELPKALDALRMHEQTVVDYMNDPAYHIAAYNIYESLGWKDKEVDAYKSYIQILNTTIHKLVNQDTRFIKERYENQIFHIQKQNLILTIILSSVIAIAVCLAVIYYVIRNMRRKEEKHQRYLEEISYLESERDSLMEMLENNVLIDKETQQVISARLNILNRFFSSAIQSNEGGYEKISEELNSLTDNANEFLRDTRKLFTGLYPGFIEYLRERGLTDSQIEICCLYALGLKGKDVINYTKRKRHYIENMEIRSKLGLNEHDQNLGGYLQHLLKKFEDM